MQYKHALENEILDDPRTANAFNEFAPITNVVLGTGSMIGYDELRQKYDKIINYKNNIALGMLQCDSCLSRVSYEDNKIVYCELCLSAVHIKCHGRKLLYAAKGGAPFDQFICERCKYLVDNDFNEYENIKCKFCDELTGILIYIDKNHKKNMMVGWLHLCCVFWHSSVKFADECAIQRGLITEYETMKEKQADEITGEPLVYCSKHTRLFRDLQDNPDMPSILTEMNSSFGEDDDDKNENQIISLQNPEEDTFEHFMQPDEYDQKMDLSYFEMKNDPNFIAQELNQYQTKLEIKEDYNPHQNTILAQLQYQSQNQMSQSGPKRRGRKKHLPLGMDANQMSNLSYSMSNYGGQQSSLSMKQDANEESSMNNIYGQQQYRKRGPKPKAFNHQIQLSDKLGAQRMDEVSYFEQIIEHQKQDHHDALEAYPDTTKYYYHREHRETKKRGRMSFKEKIQLMHDQQLDRSSCINVEFSQLSNENPSSTYIANNAAQTDLVEVKQYLQTRPELRQDFGLKLRMNAGEKIMYDVRPEMQSLFKLKSPSTRRDILTAFVNFCNDNDLVDLQCHHYNISRHPKLRAMLGVDVMESREIFKYLKGLVTPFSVEEREAERKRLVEMKFRNQLAIQNQNMSEDFSNNQGFIEEISFRN
ncbi:phd zinc finger-containing protein [Stylonychia lemnae]|uniref:Phd zinc finger-containing protein n=1 Tax=Stylonychia lemnae TaxID=5949 RepID=A0A078B9W2_STYLE|nr:phd zinc finger-containing protein [Stylonychia lemnae]|eukprot:CDW91305.1 phd zinc finger-containing protein [Stylonychia lemnae]